MGVQSDLEMLPHLSLDIDLAKSIFAFATALLSFLAVLKNRKNLVRSFKKI